MARQSQAERQHARNVTGYYLDAASARAPREAAWEKSYKRTDPSYVDRSKVKGPFPIKVPYGYRVLEQQAGALMEASLANGRWVTARSTTPEHGNVGRVVTQALENQFRIKTSGLNTNNEEQLDACARMALTYDTACVLVEWRRTSSWWGCRLTALDPYDVFFDWKGQRFILVRRVVTLGELGDMCRAQSEDEIELRIDPATGEEFEINHGPRDGGRALKAFRKIEKAIKSGEKTGFLYSDSYASDHGRTRQTTLGRVEGSDDGQDDRVNIADDPYNARLVVVEYHETRADGIVSWTVPSFDGAEESLVIRLEDAPYKCCQIIPFTPRPRDKEAYGFGIGEVIGHSAEAMDVFYRAALRLLLRTADPATLYRKGLRLRQEYLRSQSGIAIPVDNTTSDIKYMEPPGTTGFHQLGFTFARDMADMGTGESDQRRGRVGGASSATEAAIAEVSGNATDRRILARWKRFIEQIGYVMLNVMKVHVTREELIPTLGRDSEEFLKLKPEYLEGAFEVTFGGNTTGSNPAARQAGYRNIASTYGPSGVVDIAELARADIREMGEPDPDRFLLQKSPVRSVSPKHEHAALFRFGEQIEVSPNDDHARHLAAHSEEMKRRAAVGHPRLVDLGRHIQVHYEQFVMQQAAQPQAAGPSGPQPFDPSQAGQPGQPATYTDRTAAVNDQRQQSNNGSPGAPPGPSVVPGRTTGQVVNGAMLR